MQKKIIDMIFFWVRLNSGDTAERNKGAIDAYLKDLEFLIDYK